MVLSDSASQPEALPTPAPEPKKKRKRSEQRASPIRIDAAEKRVDASRPERDERRRRSPNAVPRKDAYDPRNAGVYRRSRSRTVEKSPRRGHAPRRVRTIGGPPRAQQHSERPSEPARDRAPPRRADSRGRESRVPARDYEPPHRRDRQRRSPERRFNPRFNPQARFPTANSPTKKPERTAYIAASSAKRLQKSLQLAGTKGRVVKGRGFSAKFAKMASERLGGGKGRMKSQSSMTKEMVSVQRRRIITVESNPNAIPSPKFDDLESARKKALSTFGGGEEDEEVEEVTV